MPANKEAQFQKQNRIADSAFDSLHSAGWSVGEIGGTNGWYVYGHRGHERIDAHGRTQSEAWAAALEQAESMPAAIVEGKP